MKKTLILLLMLTSILWAQFDAGTISAGSLFSYTSMKSGSDSDAVTSTTVGENAINFYAISVKPSLNYFIADNLSINAVVSRVGYGDDDYSSSFFFYGPGATYYLNGLYAGGAWVILNTSSGSGSSESTTSANWMEFHGGLLHKLVENVYLDINASYLMGTGDQTREYDGNESTSENEETMLSASIGIKAFFKLK